MTPATTPTGRGPGRLALAGSLAALAALVLLAALAAASLWQVLPAAWADASTLRARTAVNDWRDGTGPANDPALWERTRAQLQAGLTTAPGNAQLHDDLGFLHAARSQGMGKPPLDSPDHALQQTLMDSAIDHYRAATALRPVFPYSWTYLALAKHYRGQHDAEFWQAYDRALQYGHSEAALHGAIVEVALALWPRLGAQRQHSIGTLVAAAKPASRARLQEMARYAGITLPG